MLEQKSQAVTFLFEFLDAAGLGITGVSAYVSVSRLGTGTAILALSTNTAATEVDATNHPGLYKYTLAGASTGTADEYFATAIWQSGGTPACKTQRALWIVGQPWIEHVDADITDPVTIANDAINAASIAANAISATRIADGAITAAKIAANAIHATAIATDAINAASIKADAVTKIRSALLPTAVEKTYTVTYSGNPLADVLVEAFDNDARTGTAIDSGYTDSSGEVKLMLYTGTTVYLWRRKAGYTFTNPDTEVVE